jgi:hypothetical protein
MSASQFSVKRRFISGENDWRYQSTKAPVTTSENQFIYGVKQFADPIKALGNVLCSGSYYGDGSHLTNVTGNDPTKLPLTGGTLTGSLTVNAPGIISGNGSGLTGVTATDPSKLPLTGGTLTGSLIVNSAVAGQNSTLSTQQLIINNGTGGTGLPVLSLNQTASGGGSLVQETYNQKAPASGEFSRHSYFAKNSSNAKIEFARIHQNVANASTSKGRMDFDVATGPTTLSNFLSINGNSGTVQLNRDIEMNGYSITEANIISTVNSNRFGKNTVQFYSGSSSFPPYTPEDQLRLTVINEGVPDQVLPIAASFPGTWGTITCSADFYGFTYVGTKSGFIYYSSDGNTWNGINDSFQGRVLCMAAFNGELFVGGDFQITNNGINAYMIARVDSGNNVNPVLFTNYFNSFGFNGSSVRTLFASSSGYLFIGGKFYSDSSSALAVNNIAIMDSSSNLYCIDNSSVSGNTGTNAAVNFIAENPSYAPNYFVIGGEFDSFNNSAGGYTANRNVVWKSNGAYDTDFSVTPYEVVSMNNDPLCITLNGNQFYIGGYFSGLTYGDYLATFGWNGSTYILDANPYGASPGAPVIAVYQNSGIYWSLNNGEFFDAGNSVAQAPYGSSWSWIYRAVWGQLLISTESGAQDPVIAFYFFTDDTITLTLTVGEIYNGASVYAGGIILYNKGAVVDLMFQAAYNRWYVVSQLGAGFF